MNMIDRETKVAQAIADATIATLRKFGRFHSETLNDEIVKAAHQAAFVAFRDFYRDDEVRQPVSAPRKAGGKRA